MRKIYLPKEEFETFRAMSFTDLMLEFSNWWNDKNMTTKGYKVFEMINKNHPFPVSHILQDIIKGEIEVLQEKEIKYRLYYRQECTPCDFEYHYIDKNAILTETDDFAKITTFTKEEAYELIDDLGEWLEEWLYEVED